MADPQQETFTDVQPIQQKAAPEADASAPQETFTDVTPIAVSKPPIAALPKNYSKPDDLPKAAGAPIAPSGEKAATQEGMHYAGVIAPIKSEEQRKVITTPTATENYIYTAPARMGAAGSKLGTEYGHEETANATTPPATVPAQSTHTEIVHGMARQVPNYSAEQEQAHLQQAAQEHPIAYGTAGAVGGFAGGTIADPTNWALALTGAEAGPLVSKLVSAAFAAKMGYDTVEGAKQLGADWDNITPAERYERIAQLGLSSVFSGLATAHATEDINFRKTPEVKQAEANVKALEADRATAQAAYDNALAEHNKHVASHAQGIQSPEKVVKELNKTKAALDEATAHHELAKEYLASKVAAQRAGTAGGKTAVSVKPTPAPAPEVPTEAIEAQPSPLKPLGTPEPAPALPAINVKTPGQIQPETFPQTPTEQPRTPLGRIELAGGQGTMGKPPLLTEGTPEGPQLPTGGLPQIKMPEAPKPAPQPAAVDEAALRALSAKEGKVVETPEKKVGRLLQEALKPTEKTKETPAPETKETPEEYKGEERRENARPATMTPTEIEEAMKNRKPVHTPFDVTQGAMDTIKRDKDLPKSPAEEFSEKTAVPKSEPTGYKAKNEELVPTGAEGREAAKSAEEYHPAVEQKVNELSDENLKKLAKAHGLNPDEYDFNARDERRHRIERDQLAKDITAHMGEDEKINIGRAAESVERREPGFASQDTTAQSKAARAEKIFPRLRGPVDQYGNPTIRGGAPEAEEAEKYANPEKGIPETSLAKGPEAEAMHAATVASDKLAEEWKNATEEKPKTVDVAKHASDYNKTEGLSEIKPEKVEKSPRAKEIADAYTAMKHNPNDPEVKKSYTALIDDVKKQWDYATNKMGIKIEPTDKDPYNSYEELRDDVKNNKTLKVFKGGNPLPEDHPLAKVDPKTGETYNTMFRAVHDLFGHLTKDNDFSENGEENAWNTHRQMMSPEAVPAMTTETRGQTSWFFNHGEKPGTFAEQKAGILPDFANAPTPDAKATLDHIRSGKDFAVVTAENPNNERSTPEENEKRNRALVEDLRKKGYEPVPVEGNTKDVEGQKEHSYFVPDITPKEAAELGRKHGQAAVLTTEGLHDLKTDTVNPSDNKKILTGEEARKQPYYTKVGDTDFSVPIDFDKVAEPGKSPLPTVSGGSGKLPTGDQLIKKYGESSGDPKDLTFILKDGRGVANTGIEHDHMLGGKTNEKIPPRERFIAEGNIRVRPRMGAGGREVSISIPESGVTEKQLDYIKKMSPQLKSGAVMLEVGKRGGDYWTIEYGDATPEALEDKIRDLGPVLNDKGAPIDEFGNPTVSGGSPAAGTKQSKESVEGLKEKLPELAQKHLTEEEKNSLTTTATGKPRTAGTTKFIENMEKIPSVQEYKDIALAGEGARKWYSRSTAAFDAMHEEAPDYFKEGDKDKFMGVLAGSSPQQSVAMNLREALGFWKEWNDAGRPVPTLDKWKQFGEEADKAWKEDGSPRSKGLKTGASMHWDYAPQGPEWKAENLFVKNLTLPDTKVPNIIKALRGADMWPDLTKNAAFKAPSFAENLRKWINGKSTGTKYVTNDSWMGLFGGIDKRALSKPENYHPLSVATRAAAKELGWEPEEAQAAIWSFTQALTEKGEEDPEIIRQYSEDFKDLLANDEQTRSKLEDLGVNLDQLDKKLEAIGEKPEISGRTTATTSRSVDKLKQRIEEARGKGAIPTAKSAQGELGFRETHPTRTRVDEAVGFDPEKFRTQTDEPLTKLGEKRKKSPFGTIR